MDQVHVIRHKVLVEKRSRRAVAREMGVSRNTVVRYLMIAEPKRIESEPRPRPTWAHVEQRFFELVEASSAWTGGKQRLTAARLHELLRAEGYDVGYTTVKEAYAEWKRDRREVFVPLTYHPGELAQVDFFEVFVDIDDRRVKAWMFVMRLMYSGRDFAQIYERQDQISFLDGHARAFEHFGAVPQRIAYDNLKSAVVRVLVGSERLITDRFRALASHYLFEPSFCRPGEGHDKGGVEARGRAIRLQHLVPIPRGHDLHAINEKLLAEIQDRFDRRKPSEGRTSADLWAEDLRQMLSLNPHPFDARASQLAVASSRAMVKVEGAHYSVPCEWHDRDVTVHIGPYDVEIVGPDRSVSHRRQAFGRRAINYLHYLTELAKKPQAVRQVAPELVRDLGEPYGRIWRALVDEAGPNQAARVFARVLGHIVERGKEDVAAMLLAALQRDKPLLLSLAPPRETTQPISLPASLESVVVLSGSAADYDALLVGGAR